MDAMTSRSMGNRTLVSLIGAGLVLAAIALYGRTTRFDFLLWDDNVNIRDNPVVASASLLRPGWMFTTYDNTLNRYMPLGWYSIVLNARITGMNPGGFHLANVLGHALNAVLLFLLLARLLERARPGGTGDHAVSCAAGLAALIWTVHPLNTEPVSWIMARNHIQAVSFALLAVLVWLRAADPSEHGRRRWILIAASALLYLVSLLIYPIALELPVVLLLLDAFPLRRLKDRDGKGSPGLPLRAILIEKSPFLIASGLIGAINLRARGLITDLEPGEALAKWGWVARLAQAFHTCMFYPVRFLRPGELSTLYPDLIDFNPFRPGFVVSGAVVLLLTLSAVLLRKSAPGFAAAWFAYLTLLLTKLGLTEPVHHTGDRYFYLAGIPLMTLLAAGLRLFIERTRGTRTRHAIPLAALLASGWFALAAWNQSGMWRNNEIFFDTVIQRFGEHRQTGDLHFRLGNSRLAQGNEEGAMQAYEAAIRLDPAHRGALINKGVLHAGRNELEKAIGCARQASRISPPSPLAFNNLGLYLLRISDFKGAAQAFARAARLMPGDVEILSNLASALIDDGNADEGVLIASEAVSVNSLHPRATWQLARGLLSQGKHEEAIPILLQAASLDRNVAPQASGELHRMGQMWLGMGELMLARRAYEAGLVINPGDEAAASQLKSLKTLTSGGAQ